MSHLHTPMSGRGGSRLDDPKYLFSAEAREAIKRYPSMTPVPIFHHQPHHAPTSQSNSQLTSPSALSNSTSLSSSAQPLDHRSMASASSSYMSTGLIRPQPRSPHDAESWDSTASLGAHSPFQQTYGAYPHYQTPHAHMTVLPSSTSLPQSPSSAIRPTAPFFASLAKHSSLRLASPSPARPYFPAAVSVYGQFDSAVWQRTPLPKSLSGHPMAVAQSEARRQREEWERENKRLWELEHEREELLRRGEERQRMQQEMHMRAMQAQDDAAQQQQHTPVLVKRGNAAAIGSRPSLSIRRSPQLAADAGFVTPAAKPRRRPDTTSDVKKRLPTAAVGKERDEWKETAAADVHEKEQTRQREASATDGAREDEQVDDSESSQEGVQEEEIVDANESEENEETRTGSDTEDEEDGAALNTEANKDEDPVRLSPVKKRSSNRIYTVPSSTHAPPHSTSASSTAVPLPPPPAGLKPDMSLTRWYFHIQQHNPPNPPRIVIKGTHATEGPWSSGYVTDRERSTGRVLLTNSRRYVLLGEMEHGEMQRDGWSESMRRACVDGLPVEWKDWLIREVEQRVQEQQEREAKTGLFDFLESEQKADVERVEQKEQREEEEKTEEEPTSHRRLSPLIRARRSPAPIRQSEWWEDEVMRLVEAVSMYTTADDNNHSSTSHGSDTVNVWRRVAEEVGGGRRWEECKRKFEEVRREQSRGIKESEKKKEKGKRVVDRKDERRVSEKKAMRKNDRVEKGGDKSSPARSINKAAKRSLIPSATAREKKSASREPNTERRHKLLKPKAAEVKDDDKEADTIDGDEEAASGQFYAVTDPDGVIGSIAQHHSHSPQPTTTTTKKKKRTATNTKPPPTTTTPSSATSPRTPAAAVSSVEHAILNPHDVAYTHTRRSGRAVMAPLRHWELEREVNGVILRGFQHAGEAIRRVLTEKEKMDKDASSYPAAQPPHQYTAGTRRRVGGGRERGGRARVWSVDEREQLRLAYMWVEPSEKGFWLSVSRFMAGRSAEECQAEYEKMYPTPKRRGKRKDNDQVDNDDKQAAEEKTDQGGKEELTEDGNEPGGQTKKRKRMTTIKREIRDALDSRQQQHSGDDLFHSTPYKSNAELAHAAPHPLPNNRRGQRTNEPLLQSSTDGEEAEGSLLFACDTALADMQVQRVVKERRRVRANRGKVVVAEKRRQGKEEERSKRCERLAEGANEFRLGVRQLEAEDEEKKQELMDEMEDVVVDDEDEFEA